MTTFSENQNGTTHDDLVQRVARLEGAIGRHEHPHRPWWMGWLMVWLVFAAIRSSGWHCADGRPWRMAWPIALLLVFAVMHFVWDRRDHDALSGGGKR